MTLSPGMRLGSYEIVSPLGAGGMGEVYKAKDTRLARDVAVKVLPEDSLEGEERKARFEREAKLLAALNHPSVAAIGVTIRSTVLEFVPCEQIAWNAFGIGDDAYHAWEITRTAAGTRVLTEETQYGWAARLGSIVFPNRMWKGHQTWLERLAAMAQRGRPLT